MRGYRLCPITAADDAQRRRLAAGRDDCILELAWDGHRVQASVDDRGVRIVSADFQPWQRLFARLEAALRRLPVDALVLEGHLIALGDDGRPDFERLRTMVVERTCHGAVLACWDLHHLDGEDLRALPLAERRDRLLALLEQDESGRLVFSEPLEGELDGVLASLRAMGIRGLVARPSDGAYPPGDGAPWLSLPCEGAAITWDRSLSPPPTVTNADKVLFPRDGYTKTDVAAYYRDVAPVLLRHMEGRPVVGQRWPDGIDEFTWYQHRVPPRRLAPDYLKPVFIDGDPRIAIRDEQSLLWLVNQAALTFHGWASRVGSLEQPDWAVIDLDPGPSTRWATTIRVAQAIRRLLELLELPSVVKTSGQSGLHVLVPLSNGHSPQDAHDFALGVSTMIAKLEPEEATLDPRPERRGGRLFLDHMQHFVGKALVLPYALRAVDGAPVSAPLRWSEVTPALDPSALNLKTMRGRLDSLGDLAAPLLQDGADLSSALERFRAEG